MSEQSNDRIKSLPKQEDEADVQMDIPRGDTQLFGVTAPDPRRSERDLAKISSSAPPEDARVESGDQKSIVSFGDKQIDLSKMHDSYIGQVVGGRFEIVEFIDRGGMGEVYLGVNEAIKQKVAVKFLHKKFTSDEGIITRFGNEAKSYARVTHPNAVTLLDYGQHEDGALYIVMEYVEGASLSKTIKEHGLFSPEQVISIGKQCCDVLTAAHNEGVIHRDLKPDNLMLIPGPRERFVVKVLDFGIAKISGEDGAPMTETGAIFGTPEFMSPEQARGDSALPQSDLYALGIILYYMATGRLPFGGKNKFAVLNKHLNDAPPRPTEISPHADVPPALEAVILKCLNKEPGERYAAAEDLYEALDDVREQLGTSRTTSAPPLSSKRPVEDVPGEDEVLDDAREESFDEDDFDDEDGEFEDSLEEFSSEPEIEDDRPKVKLKGALQFGSDADLDEVSGSFDEDEHAPLELEVDMGAERATEETDRARPAAAEELYWDEDEYDPGPSGLARFGAFMVILAVVIVGGIFGAPYLLGSKKTDPSSDTSPMETSASVDDSVSFSQGDMNKILMTGQVLGLLTSAQEHLESGDLDLTRKNLATAELWLTESELPEPARIKREALTSSLAALEGLENKADTLVKAGDCTALRKLLPEIKAISPALARKWLARADACSRSESENKGSKKPDTSKPAEVENAGASNPDRGSKKPDTPPDTSEEVKDPPPTETTPPENKTEDTTSKKPDETKEQPDEKEGDDPDSGEEGGGEEGEDALGLPPKIL